MSNYPETICAGPGLNGFTLKDVIDKADGRPIRRKDTKKWFKKGEYHLAIQNDTDLIATDWEFQIHSAYQIYA